MMHEISFHNVQPSPSPADLLSLTSALLDNSDEIWDETRRVAKHAEVRPGRYTHKGGPWC